MPPEKTKTVTLKGNLNIQKVESLHADFLSQSKVKEDLLLDFSSVTDMDFAVLQLLYSLNQTYLADGKSLHFLNVSPKVREWFILSDFESLIEEK